MFTSLLTFKSAGLSLLVGALALVGQAQAATLQDHGGHDHGDHGAQAETEKQGFAGDPYLLSSDPVSGKDLGPIAKQVIVDHEGRELRFSGEKTAAKFKQDPKKYVAAVDEKMIEQQMAYYPLETCVVSGEKLGGDMGDAVDVIYKNRLVRLCCNGCKKKLAKNSAGFIAQLDAAVIAKQGKSYSMTSCPVSGEKLGGMGDPIDVVMGNRLVRLCCKGCVKKVKKDPLAYLDKMGSGGKGHDDHGGHSGH